MIYGYRLSKLSEQNRNKILDVKGHRLVNISSDHGIWRKGGNGYTTMGSPDAWILTLKEAYDRTQHCGPEKKVCFPYVEIVDSYIDDVLKLIDIIVDTGELSRFKGDSKKAIYNTVIIAFIDRLREVANIVIKDTICVDIRFKADLSAYIEQVVVPLPDREDRIAIVWSTLLIKMAKYSTNPSERYMTAVCICFYIPLLVDCWDNKI